MKEEINKDTETLKNNQSEINNSKSQINISIKSMANRERKLKREHQEQKIK
jgi:hypothetical protein